MALTNNEKQPDAAGTVVAVFYEDDRIDSALQNLEQHGFHGAVSLAPELSVPQPLCEGNVFLAGAETGLVTGATVGGVFGLLLGIGSLPALSLLMLCDIGLGAVLGVIAGAALGGVIGCAAAWRYRKAPDSLPTRAGVLVSVQAGPRDEEAKSALIESGGDLSPTNAIEASLI